MGVHDQHEAAEHVKHNRLLHFFGHLTSPVHQFTTLAITSVSILLISLGPFVEFNSLEPSPQIFSVTPKKLRGWGGSAIKVLSGLHITNFPEFEVPKNRFTFGGIIWFEFDPALISLETVEKFSFEKGEILKKVISDTKVIEGRFFVQYDITVKFASNLSYEFFPLDDHRVFLALTNKFVSPSELIYQSYISGFTISKNIFIAGWKIVGRNVVTGYSEAYLDEQDKRKVVFNPKIVYSIDFERSGVQQVFLIFLPLFLMLFVGIFSFTFDATKTPQAVMPLSLTSVAAILSYRFVIQRMSPEVGYFLLSDHIFTLFL